MGAVHQRGVVVVLDEVSVLGDLLTHLGLVGDGHRGGVRGVVEVDDVDVKHQHRRARDLRA